MHLAISPVSKLQVFLNKQEPGDAQCSGGRTGYGRRRIRFKAVFTASTQKGAGIGRKRFAAGNGRDSTPRLFPTPGSRFGCSKS
jgi:hypothetical protein